jgi:hypothetical protein
MLKMIVNLYFFNLLGTSKYKIGITNNIGRRLRQIQTGNHRPVVVAGYIEFRDRKLAKETERTIHREFSGKRIGGEWFWLAAGDLDEVSRRYDLLSPTT